MPDFPALRCDAMTKSFAGVTVLKTVSFDLTAGHTLGIVGENGAGKSTLMNLIGGVHRPDSGHMQIVGEDYAPSGPRDAERRGVAFVHQELNLFPNLSVAENVFLTDPPRRGPFIDRAATALRTRALMRDVGLDVPPETAVESLPPGDRQLIEIAKALRSDARIVIFDEPTTSLTQREVDRLFDVIAGLRAKGIAVLFISHALDHVLRLCDDVLVLRDGCVAASGIARDFTETDLIRAMVGRDVTQVYPPRGERVPGAIVLQADGLSEPGVLENVTLDVREREIVGVAGLMGSGRSEMARVLFGLDRARQGTVRLLGEDITALPPRDRIARGMAFVTESRRHDGLFLEASIADNVRIVHPASDVPALVQTLRVACGDPEAQAAGTLSGGNQQKTVIAKWLAGTPRLFILDEPTRGIDVGARQEIYSLIADLATNGAALIVISSDIEELIGLCDRILVMAKGEIRGTFAPSDGRETILRAAL